MSSINVGGLLLNSLSTGFTVNHSIGELVDNSNDASATRINMHIQKNITIVDTDYPHVFVHADNGKGMNAQEFETAFVLHERKEASNGKQGRYGIGGKEALFVLTQLQHTPIIISRKNGELHFVEIDLKEIMKKNVYSYSVNKMEEKKKHIEYKTIWDTYAIDKKQDGTVFFIPCDKMKHKKLCENMGTTHLEENLEYYLNLSYNILAQKGIFLTVLFDEKTVVIKGTDPLSWPSIQKDYKAEEKITVWQHPDTKEIHAVFKNGKNKDAILNADNTQNEKFSNKDFKKIGIVNIKFAFSKDRWVTEDKKTIVGIQKDIALQYKTGASTRESMDGRYYYRNEKCIKHVPKIAKKSGDHDTRDFYDHTRTIVQFPVEMDEIFNVELNKSTINEIHETLRRTIYEELEKKFIQKLVKDYKKSLAAKEETDSEYESDSDSEVETPKNKNQVVSKPSSQKTTPPVSKVENTKVNSVTAPSAKPLSAPTNIHVPEEKPIPSKSTIQTRSPSPLPKPQPQAQVQAQSFSSNPTNVSTSPQQGTQVNEFPIVPKPNPPAQITVPEHTRSVPMGKKDAIGHIHALFTTYAPIIETLYESSTNEAKREFTKIYEACETIKTFLEKNE